MVDYRLKQVFIFVVFNLFMTVKTQNSLDMCEIGVKDVDDGESGYLTFDRSTLYPDPMTISGTCVCVISAENRDPDTKIATIYETKICGTAGCTEQLLIDAGRRSYDSCTSDIGTADGECVNIPHSTVLSNPWPISGDQSIKIQFSFNKLASSEQVTDSFTLRIQVEDVCYSPWCSYKIHIECSEPVYHLPTSTCSTTDSTRSTTADQTQTNESASPPDYALTTSLESSTSYSDQSTPVTSHDLLTDDVPETTSAGSNEPAVGLIAGLSVGGTCVITAIIVTAVFITRRRKMSDKPPPTNRPIPNIYNETPNPDSFSTELVDNAMYSSQTTDMQSADTSIVDNPQYSSTQNTNPGLYTAGTALIENTSYMGANMNHIGHPKISSEQDNVTYCNVENSSVNNGGYEGSYQNVTSSVYDGGSKLVDNTIYNNDPEMPDSDELYSSGTEIVDNPMYG